MIKLQDFAKQMGVTDRAIQKHLKNYADEFDGLFQRRGPNGTWLTDEACELLRSKMKQQPIVLGDTKSYADLEDAKRQIADLQNERAALAMSIAELSAWKAEKALEIAAAEQTRMLLSAAEQEKKLLEGFVADAKAEIAVLSDEKSQAEGKARTASENAQRAQNKLEAAHERERLLKQYATALEEWSSLGWWHRRKKAKPVMPELSEEE